MTDQIRKRGSAVIRDVQITFDCADPAALAAFWAEALGYQVQAPPGDFESWEQALEAMGVPPENRNDASAVVDPRVRGRACSSSGCRSTSR
ncbi:VOC family protein [Micromonospora sp. M12]